MKKFSIIVAATSSNMGIGRRGDLPWKLPGDMAFFKRTTLSTTSKKSNAVIMGRTTYESIPEKFRPLSNRVNVILSRNPSLRQELNLPDSVMVASSFTSALELLTQSDIANDIDQIFVIGGGTVYREAISSPYCGKIFFTCIETDIADCDTFFPPISALQFRMASRSAKFTENDIAYRFIEFDSISEDDVSISGAPSLPSPSPTPSPSVQISTSSNAEEEQYLDIVRDILDHGTLRGDRTGTGTLSKFGVQMRFSLRDRIFPLLTTKKVFWRGVAEELLWFVKGSTDANILAAQGIHIWDGNGSREFLDSRGLHHREIGDLGPVYGFQWRHFGAEYKDFHTDYTNKGIDQLKDCIHKIKTCPEDRRIIMTAWNPSDLDKMALPPCHMFCQFYVANGELSCQMYQRSADMGLGVPFNIASYSLLTVMLAQVCGLKPGDFVHSIGDAHVYTNHIDALKEQIKRTPRAFPRLIVNPEVNDIDGFKFTDFTIEGYAPDATIKMKMAV